MRITGFIWLEEVLEKLARKHHVHEHEVVEVFDSRPKFRFMEKGHREGENVYAALGRSDAEDTWLYSSFTRTTVAHCRCRRGI